MLNTVTRPTFVFSNSINGYENSNTFSKSDFELNKYHTMGTSFLRNECEGKNLTRTFSRSTERTISETDTSE